jgi:hypothetical protein
MAEKGMEVIVRDEVIPVQEKGLGIEKSPERGDLKEPGTSTKFSKKQSAGKSKSDRSSGISRSSKSKK